jgi:cation:H+ antiporter
LSSNLIALLALLLCAGVIYWSCEYFVAGVEWVGVKAGISQNAVGTVLAAFGTALPESVVTFVAVVFGRTAAAKDIGVGAALGGPLALATIAYPVVGIMLLLTRSQAAHQPIELNRRRLARDQGWFLLIFACKFALGYLVFSFKPWLGWLFLLAYVLYTITEMRSGGDESEGEPEALLFQGERREPGWWHVGLQTLLSLAVIFAASHVFVGELEVVGPWIGLPAAVVSLILTPIATELPETMNAIIWIRQGKHRLALSNISGSMMVQATVPTALGLFGTPWLFGPVLALAAALTMLTISGLWLLLLRNKLSPRRLAAFAILYGVFAVMTWLLWHQGFTS